MTDTEENIDYFNYGDYIQGKNEEKRLFSRRDDYLDRYQNIMTIIKVPERFLTITDIFQKLHRYLYNSHPFMMSFNHNYCRYVNFYFNKLINPLYSEEDKKEYFSLFHKFGNEFQIIKGTKDTCLPYLYYINPDIFTKINLLYELYDKYSTRDEFMKSQTESACDKLRSFRFLYNEIIRKYDGNANKLIEKLIELKKLIGQNIFSPNTKICGEHVTYFNEPVKYLEEKDKEKKRLESLEEELLRAQRQQQQQKKQQEQMKESSGYKHTQTEDETQSPEQLLSSKPQEVQGSPVITEQSHPHVNKLVQGLSAYPGIPKVEPSPYKQEMEENEVEKHGTVYPSVKKEELGYLGKMQGFITDTLGQVEPAPILGVSGGMGALFLLFKYTPVGTFFGGRRGRNHRIPSGFPGAYPGFPEYYDGNFGNMPINISYQAE
ncbi:hypothetical protein PVC01_000128400 [Plasmodium vivax]|uniref:VIR protein n=1 Tax=Plasmodium vivax TaxID=5855 RepID=A0A1G4E5T5_PLAVI|nr:hypothetical protein PVC01_000128400 [Plasmodium vivax]